MGVREGDFMTDQELIKALRSINVETGSLACLGCGYEHNCGIHGCAIMRAAADRLELSQRCRSGSYWMPMPEPPEKVERGNVNE